jgi:hypothetical protein
MNKAHWHRKYTALLLLVPLITYLFVFNISMWFETLANQEPNWYISALMTWATIVVPVYLFTEYVKLEKSQ